LCVCCDIGDRQLISENVDTVENSSTAGKRRKLSPVRQLYTKALSDGASDTLMSTSALIGDVDSSVDGTGTLLPDLEARSVNGVLWHC